MNIKILMGMSSYFLSTLPGFKKLLAEALPLLIDPKNELIKKPELSPADMNRFNTVLSIK